MKKLLLSLTVLAGLCASAQDAPLYTTVTYAQAVGYDGYEDFVPEAPITVEAYSDYIILKNWSGVEGRDLYVGFDQDEAITFLQAYVDGEAKDKFTGKGYSGYIYTGLAKADSDFYVMQVYMASGFSNAISDPETQSGYVALMFYNGVSEAAYYYVPWGYSTVQEVIGAEDNTTGWWTAWSQENLGFEGDGSMHYEFYNYTNGEQFYNNWVLVLTNAPYTPNDGEQYNIEQELVVFRADNYGWGPLYASSTLENNYNWETFKTDMNQAWVEIDITREGQTVEVNAVTYTLDDQQYTYNITVDGVKDAYLGSFLTVEGGHLEIYDAYVEEVTGIASVVEDTMAPAVYYNLQGMAVNADNMTTGIYIMRQGNSAKKVLIRK